jgi:YVTN family beta-propeller protein
VAVGRDPYGAALSPDGKQVYSGHLADNTVSVIDVASLKVVATITGFKQARLAIVFTRDGKLAYALNEAEHRQGRPQQPANRAADRRKILIWHSPKAHIPCGSQAGMLEEAHGICAVGLPVLRSLTVG